MSEFKFPRNDLDTTSTLLNALGSFWRQTYEDTSIVESLIQAKAIASQQSHLDLLALIDSMSRQSVPVFHKENWHFLTFKESEITSVDLPANYFDSDLSFDDTYKSTFDTTESSLIGVKLPEGMTDCRVILNRIVGTSLTLNKNIDFVIRDGFILFRENPFDSEYVARRDVWNESTTVDHEAGLWLFKSDWDWQTVYNQFGYSIGIQMRSSDGYKTLVNAIMDALVAGTKVRDLHYLWSAVTGVPLVLERHETVEEVTEDATGLVIVTDKHAYRFKLGSSAMVSVGQTLNGGDPLVDSLQFFTFTDGQVDSQIKALTTGASFIGEGYFSDLTWENKEVDLVLDEEGDLPRISWELGGYPGDVEFFWDKANQVPTGDNPSLYECLVAKYGNIPAKINPLQFLCENIFRNNLFVVLIKPTLFVNKDALGLEHISSIRKILPPNLAMIVIVELKFTEQSITLTNSGTDNTPGYAESQLALQVAPFAEEVSAAGLTEKVRLFQIRGQCT